MMGNTEKELEKKSLAEITALVLAHEKKIKELAEDIKIGKAKPTSMLALNSELALLKKARDKKMHEQERSIQRGQLARPAVQMKSYDDYLKSKKK
jgi:hypothetical protein